MLSEKKFCGSKVSFNYPTWARTRMARISAAVILLGTSQAFAAAPAVVVDAQQTIGTGNLVGNFNPSQVAVAPNGTVYVADTSNNRVLQFIPGLPGAVTPTVVNTGGLSSPQGLAVDAPVDPDTNKIKLSAECLVAFREYLGLAPTGEYSAQVTTILQNADLENTAPQNTIPLPPHIFPSQACACTKRRPTAPA